MLKISRGAEWLWHQQSVLLSALLIQHRGISQNKAGLFSREAACRYHFRAYCNYSHINEDLHSFSSSLW